MQRSPPAAVAARVLELARLSPGLRVLIPYAAAAGPLLDAARAIDAGGVLAWDADSSACASIRDATRGPLAIACVDVREHFGPPAFDRVLMLPPLKAGPSDVVAIAHAWACHVVAGGRLVGIVAAAAFDRPDAIARGFLELMAEAGDPPEGEHVPGGVAGVPARIVVLDKSEGLRA